MSGRAVSTHLADTVGSCCRSISTMSCTLSRRFVKMMMPPPGEPAKHQTHQVVSKQSITCSSRWICAKAWGKIHMQHAVDNACSMRWCMRLKCPCLVLQLPLDPKARGLLNHGAAWGVAGGL